MSVSAPITDPTANPGGDDALVDRSTKGNDGNGLSIMSDWNEFRMSASMASVLKGYNDPRLKEYFLRAVNTNQYLGLLNGLSVYQLTQPANNYNNNSHVGKRWSSTNVTDINGKVTGSATSLSTRQNIMCSAEVYFLRAEGAILGWNLGGTPQTSYNQGIIASMNQWGIIDPTIMNHYINSMASPTAPGDYLNSSPMTNIPVKFDPSNPAVQLEQIMTQKWLALYPDGQEAWADYRRSHVLKLYPVVNSDKPDITNTTTHWIRRIPFLLSSYQTNGAEVNKAVNLVGLPDKVTTPLWWDKN
jgi:hypothetical protein